MSFGGGDVASLGIGLGVDPASFDAYGGITVPGTDVSVDPTVEGMLAYDSLAPLAYNEVANRADQATIGASQTAPFSPDAAMADEAIRSQQAADYNPYAHSIAAGSPIGPVTFDPIFGDYFGFSRFGPAIARDPSGNALVAETFLGNLPYGFGHAARGLMAQGNGVVPDNTFGDFPGDVVNASEEDIAAAQPQLQAPQPEVTPLPAIVAAPTASQVYAAAQPYYRRTLLDAAPAGFADFATLNDAFTRSYAMRPAIYQTPPAVDLLGRQGFVPLA
jgi:hypothetical protein